MAELNPSPGYRSQIELFKSARQELTRLFHLYRIPPEDAEAILGEVQLLLVYRWDGLENPQTWLIHTVRSRCITQRRRRRRGLAEAVDAALLDLLPNSATPERESLQADLERLLAGLPPRCRAFLRQRYGLPAEGAVAESWAGHSEKAACRCLELLADRLLHLDTAPRRVVRGEIRRRRSR